VIAFKAAQRPHGQDVSMKSPFQMGAALLMSGIFLTGTGARAASKEAEPSAERVKIVRAMYEKLPCEILNFTEPPKKAPEFLADTNGEVLRMTLVDARGISLTIELNNKTHALSMSVPVRHASMGVVVDAPREGEGVLIAQVSPGGAAEGAGLKAGDVIVKAEGDAIKDAEQLRKALAGRSPGEKFAVAVKRDGKEIGVDVILDTSGGGAFDPLVLLPPRGPEESAICGLILRLHLQGAEKDSAGEFLKVLDRRFAGAVPGTDK